MIEEKKYKNVLELYETQPEFKKLWSQNHNNKIENYYDDYGDDPNIVDGSLCDIIDTKIYDIKCSEHKQWRNVVISITKKSDKIIAKEKKRHDKAMERFFAKVFLDNFIKTDEETSIPYDIVVKAMIAYKNKFDKI